jgi:hypothetical protein
MPRDIDRARDATRTAPPMAPDGPGDAEPEPDIVDRPAPPARSKLPAIPADPELLRYRHRLDRQLAAWREGKSATSLSTSLATIATAPAPGLGWHALLIWIAPIAACGAAAFGGWWVASVPATRTGEELTQVRQALQQEQDKAEKLGAALAAAWRELGTRAMAAADKTVDDQERDALQQALQKSEAAAATFAQSLAQERERNQQLEQQLAAHRDAPPLPASAPAAESTSDKPTEGPVDPELQRLMSRAKLLLAQGDIGAARVALKLAAESGDASALFALAETFDPAVLSAWGTMGTQGDAARAGDLYAKALAAGVAAAQDRLATLRR